MFLPGVQWWEWWASCRGNQTFVNYLQMSDTWCCFLVTVDYEYVRVLVTTYQSKWIWLKCSKWWSWSDADMMLIRLERYIKMCLKTSVSHNFEKKDHRHRISKKIWPLLKSNADAMRAHLSGRSHGLKQISLEFLKWLSLWLSWLSDWGFFGQGYWSKMNILNNAHLAHGSAVSLAERSYMDNMAG